MSRLDAGGDLNGWRNFLPSCRLLGEKMTQMVNFHAFLNGFGHILRSHLDKMDTKVDAKDAKRIGVQSC